MARHTVSFVYEHVTAFAIIDNALSRPRVAGNDNCPVGSFKAVTKRLNITVFDQERLDRNVFVFVYNAGFDFMRVDSKPFIIWVAAKSFKGVLVHIV